MGRWEGRGRRGGVGVGTYTSDPSGHTRRGELQQHKQHARRAGDLQPHSDGQ